MADSAAGPRSGSASSAISLNLGKEASSPWLLACLFVPTAYFVQGLPYTLITEALPLMYLEFGLSETVINAVKSLVILAWSFKLFWAPLVDGYGTKRRWTLWCQGLGALLTAGLAALTWLPNGWWFFALSAATIGVAALVSATHDIALDGYYLLALSKRQQAFFVGIRTAAWRLALVFATGALLYVIGSYEEQWDTRSAWRTGLALTAVLFGGLALLNTGLLPISSADRPRRTRQWARRWRDGLTSYLRQANVWRLLLFIVVYRLAEVLLGSMSKFFMLRSLDEGGLGLSLGQVGMVYGTWGVGGLVVGGLLGSAIVARWGLYRTLWPLALALNVPDIGYVYLANDVANVSMTTIQALVCVEQFGYGLGLTAFTVVLMYAARGEYRTTHYAVSTGIMGFSLAIPTALSGLMKEQLGYAQFFTVVCVLAGICLLSVPLIRGAVRQWEQPAAKVLSGEG